MSSVQFSHSVVSDSLRPYKLQHARPPCPSPTPGVYSNSCPLSWWYHPAISSSVVPSPPAPNPSQHQSLFQWVNSSHEMAKVLQFQLQHQSFQWTPKTDFHWILLLSPVTSTTGYCFCFGSIPSFFLELFLHWSPIACWAPTDLGSSSFSILSFRLFILFMGFSRQEY